MWERVCVGRHGFIAGGLYPGACSGGLRVWRFHRRGLFFGCSAAGAGAAGRDISGRGVKLACA